MSRKDENRLVAADTGRLVTAFLTNYFRKYVEYDFTADLEDQLDDISAGGRDWREVLGRFWRDFAAALAETADLRMSEVLEKIDEVLAPHLYPVREDGGDPRLCPSCGKGRLSLRTAKAGGAFIGCSSYPECRYTRAAFGAKRRSGGEKTGCWAKTAARLITLRAGRFGPYVQRGEATRGQRQSRRAPACPRAGRRTASIWRARWHCWHCRARWAITPRMAR